MWVVDFTCLVVGSETGIKSTVHILLHSFVLKSFYKWIWLAVTSNGRSATEAELSVKLSLVFNMLMFILCQNPISRSLLAQIQYHSLYKKLHCMCTLEQMLRIFYDYLLVFLVFICLGYYNLRKYLLQSHVLSLWVKLMFSQRSAVRKIHYPLNVAIRHDEELRAAQKGGSALSAKAPPPRPPLPTQQFGVSLQ